VVNFFTDFDIQKIRGFLKQDLLEIIATENWSSAVEDHQMFIHSDLLARSNASPSLKSSSSISHCPILGGYVWLPSEHTIGVGLDFEDPRRITEAVARRICQSDQEYLEAGDSAMELIPLPAKIWTAKEACFKALKAFHQPTVLSEIRLTNWQTVDSHYETVQLDNAEKYGCSKAIGLIWAKNLCLSSIFIAVP
jgi:4'-phosphopantetheinyl transferase